MTTAMGVYCWGNPVINYSILCVCSLQHAQDTTMVLAAAIPVMIVLPRNAIPSMGFVPRDTMKIKTDMGLSVEHVRFSFPNVGNHLEFLKHAISFTLTTGDLLRIIVGKIFRSKLSTDYVMC